MEDITTTSGTSGAAGGASSGEDIKEDKSFLALKEEKKALAKKNADLEARLTAIEADRKSKEEEVLKQQGEYKKLWEEEQKAKLELTEKLKKKEERELNLRKIDVVMKELGQPLAKPEYWDFVGIDRIPLVEETNDIDINIAKQVALDFQKNYPELLTRKSGKLPGDAASPTKELSYDEWSRLPLTEKRKRINEVKKK